MAKMANIPQYFNRRFVIVPDYLITLGCLRIAIFYEFGNHKVVRLLREHSDET